MVRLSMKNGSVIEAAEGGEELVASREPYLPPDNPVRLAFETFERGIWDYIRRDEERGRRPGGD